MKSKIRKICMFLMVISIFASFSGCFGPGINDYVYDLSGKYKMFHVENSRIINDLNETIIDGDIVKIGWDDSFICAIQSKENIDNYWIIDVMNNNIIGPLNENDFKNKKMELGISEKIKLKKTDKYRVD